MTESKVKELGFILTKEYPHDEYVTKRYEKGPLKSEFTFLGGRLFSNDISIGETEYRTVTDSQLEVICSIYDGTYLSKRKHNLQLDHDRLYHDMMSVVKTNGTTQQLESKKMGLSPIIFRNVRDYKSLYLDTYLKIMEWLGSDVNEYLI